MIAVKCKVVMLATKSCKRIRIVKGRSLGNIELVDATLTYNERWQNPFYEAQHLYVISDDEIKVGDWYIFNWGGGTSVQLFQDFQIEDRKKHLNIYTACKKIIASTDPAVNVPYLPDDFLKQYCFYNGQLDEVVVVYKDIDKPKMYSDNTINIYFNE